MIIVGHRGAAGHVLENTLGSIEKAIKLGVDYVEVDIRVTYDGTPILMHDETVDRTTTGHGRVAELTWEALRRLPTRDGQRVPALEEVLATCRHRVGLILELKTIGSCREVIQAATASGFDGPLLYASFQHDELARLRAHSAAAPIMPLMNAVPDGIAPALQALGATHLGCRQDRIARRHVERLHEAGLQVFLFTVNSAAAMTRAATLGADALISDYPDLVQTIEGFRRSGMTP